MKYAVIGMGKSGAAAVRLLLRKGIPTEDIITFDTKQGVAQFSAPQQITALGPLHLVVSPGVPLTLPWIQELLRHGSQLTSEISLACEELSDEKIIGVTGSFGKSTTVALLGEGACAIDPLCFIGGNLGYPLADYVCDVLEGKRPRASWVVLELSSFQLENCQGLQLNLGAITSLAPNHLERYQDLQHYYDTKWSLVKMCRGPLFLNFRGGDLIQFAQSKTNPWTAVRREDPLLSALELEHAHLIGEHNQDNLALAATVALAAGWGSGAIEKMKHFAGLPHRLNNLGAVNGVRFVDDSKATAIESVQTAIQSCLSSSGGKVFVLLGGRDKGLPWEKLSSLQSNDHIIFLFFGECGPLAQKKSGLSGTVFGSLREAISAAKIFAAPGDTVLLSPGGTSLDEFKNFEDRGRFFAKQVILL